jgi:hypothetical protein
MEDDITRLEAQKADLMKHIRMNDYKGTIYNDRADAEAGLLVLMRLLALTKEKEARLQQQQQSGAGTLMLLSSQLFMLS